MTVSLVLVVIMAVLFACGVYSMLERSLTRVLIGFLLLGNATNLMLLIVVGAPGLAPFAGDATPEEMSDPMPMALTLTAIVITFAVSAFLLALIYRSWQLGQADTVQDDVEDVALRERTVEEDEVMDDEDDTADDEAATDFVGTETSPITILRDRLEAEVEADLEAVAKTAAEDAAGEAGDTAEHDGGER
jgi:multicomponent Na+:H+ antiporter subunit C